MDCEKLPNVCRILELIRERVKGPIEIPAPELDLLNLEERLRTIRPSQVLTVADFLEERGLHEYAVRAYQFTQTLANEQAVGNRDAAAIRFMRDAIQGKERSLMHLGREDEVESARATAELLTKVIDAPGL